MVERVGGVAMWAELETLIDSTPELEVQPRGDEYMADHVVRRFELYRRRRGRAAGASRRSSTIA